MDLKQHLLRQMAWSHATFGPGERRIGILDHIRKEIIEVEESKGDPEEWVDLIILAMDGLTRKLAFVGEIRRDPETVANEVCSSLLRKQGKNEGRDWPNWRTSDPEKAIEHVRIVETREYPDEHSEIMDEILNS